MVAKERRGLRVLFVDEECAMLSSIGRILRHTLAPEDEIVFEQDPQQAIQHIQERGFDLVLSELRFSRMSGERLLNEAARCNPQAVRVVLSGFEESGTALSALQCAHMFIRKPFERLELESLIQRARALCEMPVGESMRHALGGLQALPPVPVFIRNLESLLSDDNETATASDIASVVQHDIALVSKILQTVNSAFFGLAQPILDVGRAVTLLGTDIIKALVVLQSQTRPLDDVMLSNWQRELCSHSEKVAHLALAIARLQGCEKSCQEESFIAGLLHDIGRLVLLGQIGDSEISRHYTALYGHHLSDFETETFGVLHAWVGAYLLGLWGFPVGVVNALTYHHLPHEREEREGFTPLTAVHVAAALLEGKEPDLDHLSALGCEDALVEWRKLAGQ